jgi:hypothetical protein
VIKELACHSVVAVAVAAVADRGPPNALILRLVQLFHAPINSDNFLAPGSGLQKKWT